MAYHPNYYKLIYNLIQWKDELHRVKNKKYEDLIKVLQQLQIIDEEEIPSNKEIADLINLPHLKVNVLLKALYADMAMDFAFTPLKIKECRQIIDICIPYSEEKPEFKKKDPSHYYKSCTVFRAELSFIPRIGEEIRLDYMELENKFTHGYVHQITHSFKGLIHEILIEVHPFDNEYVRWQKMKVDFDKREALKKYQESYKNR